MFRYKALNRDGDYVEGESDQASEKLVIAELLEQSYTPISVDEVGTGRASLLPRFRRTHFDALSFFENLADYLDSGLAIDKALELETLSRQQSSERQLLSEMLDTVRHGGSMSNAMQEQEGRFSRLAVGVVKSGEETDSLKESLSLLAEFYRDLDAFRQKLRSALIYPAILSFVMLISIMVLFGLVIPRFKEMFVGMGVEIQGITAVVIGISDVLSAHYQVLILVILGMFMVGRSLVRSLADNASMAKQLLDLPLIGGMIKEYNLYLTAVVMQVLMKKRVNLLSALSLLSEVIENIVYRSAIESMGRDIRQGKSLQDVMDRQLFGDHFIYLIGVGAETGSLVSSFSKLASYYYKQLDKRVKVITTLAEPAIILLLGLVVGVIVVSMLQSILSVNELVS